RDMDIVQTLRQNFGHIDCGVYARVIAGGRIKAGDAISFDPEASC
ncbi:MAG: MOSC domain-containing protein, partial [Methylocystis sp.]|nr:MOSC domain-containing protein [Methylocystis sp.]